MKLIFKICLFVGLILNISCQNKASDRNDIVLDNDKSTSIDTLTKKLNKSVGIKEFVLSQNSEVFYDRIDLHLIYGKTKNNRLFKGRIMWFRNYFKENMHTEMSFSQFLNDLLTNPQDEAFIAEIVDKNDIFNKDPEILKYKDKPLSDIIERFTFRKAGMDNLFLKSEFVSPLSAKYSIAYLFYLKGFLLVEDDYEPATFFIPLNGK
ncbi:hypothetical protein [Sphingobacterium sp.]|uniref:hypothetical protein n=1 Tax=Sphingobacterium sp. TaxID=341027 RepID=UPI0031DBE6F2